MNRSIATNMSSSIKPNLANIKNMNNIRNFEANREIRQHETLLLHVGILSAPGNRAKRDLIRKSCIPTYSKLIEEKQLVYQFVVGRPNDPEHPREKVFNT